MRLRAAPPRLTKLTNRFRAAALAAAMRQATAETLGPLPGSSMLAVIGRRSPGDHEGGNAANSGLRRK
ncbi:hypothetical protein GCM10011390_10630 [Aureimonas endophytica]|uniref:Uncharacterized protein n=1 Tax=Aureimonas endophytica TaxID=2027858 RepID=A0A916ZFE9_9HYPH|nr:hypothetical protein [Aureimonas endophytica]GGD93750.1 hypothetical protein GCM10011390_10630 [Aureimonas endophytica]